MSCRVGATATHQCAWLSVNVRVLTYTDEEYARLLDVPSWTKEVHRLSDLFLLVLVRPVRIDGAGWLLTRVPSLRL